MSGNREAHKALLGGRRKLETAINGVNQLVKQVNSGAMLCPPAAEDALKRRRDLIVEYTNLTCALKAAAASLGAARVALDHLGSPETLIPATHRRGVVPSIVTKP